MTPILIAALANALTQGAPTTPPAAAAPTEMAAPEACDNQPVLMVVAGPTHDRARMLAYGQAIADSQLYQQLGGYYVTIPRTLATFEGEAPAGYITLIVRFPCLANARAFWQSRVYQEQIRPLRLNPSAGDYIVTVYPEAPVRTDMVGQVGDNSYRAQFPASRVEQVAPAGP